MEIFFKDSDAVRIQVTSVQRPKDWSVKNLVAFRESSSSVTVHVRGADYQSNRCAGIIRGAYFEAALSLVFLQDPNLQIFQFSDEHFIPGNPNFFARWRARLSAIQFPLESKAFKGMVLMSHGANVVMGNTSFSRWGAWLVHREQRKVINHRRWLFDAAANDDGPGLPSWVSLGYDARMS